VAKYLFGKRAYLSGPIEMANHEHNWRTEPKKILSEKYGLNIFDPFDDPKQNRAGELYEARDAGNWDLVEEIAASFVAKDLSLVDRSDLLFANLPYKVSTCGTHHEIINANNCKKPVLLICEDGVEKIPLWYRGFIKKEHMFGSWVEVYNFLDKIELGEMKNHKRWRFICDMI
jgi:nucleoside 2-deoxyribosyltransferase